MTDIVKRVFSVARFVTKESKYEKKGVIAVKATLKVVVAATLIMAILFGGVTAFAATPQRALTAVQMPVGESRAWLEYSDGSVFERTLNAPTIFLAEENRTYVPIRAFSELLSATVVWVPEDGHYGRVKITTTKVSLDLYIGDYNLYNRTTGTTTSMDVFPFIYQNRTYLPARFVAEALGGTVSYYPGDSYYAPVIRVDIASSSISSSYSSSQRDEEERRAVSYAVTGQYMYLYDREGAQVLSLREDTQNRGWYKSDEFTTHNSSWTPATGNTYAGIVIPYGVSACVNKSASPIWVSGPKFVNDGDNINILEGTKFKTSRRTVLYVHPAGISDGYSYDGIDGQNYDGKRYIRVPRKDIYIDLAQTIPAKNGSSITPLPTSAPTPYPILPNENIGYARAESAEFYITWADGIKRTYTTDAYAYNGRYLYKLQHVAVAIGFSTRYEYGQWVIDTDTANQNTIVLSRNRPNGQAKVASPLIRIANGEVKGQIYGVEAIVGPDGEVYVNVEQIMAEVNLYR